MADVKVDRPFYLRQIPRAHAWRSRPDVTEEEAIDMITSNVFRPEEPGHSVWRIDNSDDLIRVLVALNAERKQGQGDGAEDRFTILVTDRDLQEAELVAVRSPGETLCPWANERHFDIKPDRKGTRRLVARLKGLGREPKKFTKSVVKQAIAAAAKVNCYAVSTSSGECDCGHPRVGEAP